MIRLLALVTVLTAVACIVLNTWLSALRSVHNSTRACLLELVLSSTG